MPKQKYSYDWAGLSAVLKSAETRALMSNPLSLPVVKGSPLHQLLAKVRTILPCKDDVSAVIDYAAAKQALDCEALLHLGRLVHWLQQAPCMELYSLPSQHPVNLLKTDWFYLLSFLEELTRIIMVGASTPETVDSAVMGACQEQLVSTGMLGEVGFMHHSICEQRPLYVEGFGAASCIQCLLCISLAAHLYHLSSVKSVCCRPVACF